MNELHSDYHWLHFTTEGRRNVHANTAASTNTEETCLHPTSTDSSDGCHHTPLLDQWIRLLLHHHNKHRSRFRMSRSGPKITPIHDSNTGPKTTPTNHGTCERASRGSVRNTQRHQCKNQKFQTFGQSCGQNHRTFKRHFEKLHEGQN